MSMPNFESKAMRRSNPTGETLHTEDSYNLPDEDRDRKDLENAYKGDKAFVPSEEIEDENAEKAIYDQFRVLIEQEDAADHFGYIDMMQEIVEKLDKKEKDKFLDNSLIFLPLHRDIVNDEHLSDEEKDRLLREKFVQIFGHQVLSYDGDTRATKVSMYKKGFIKVIDKAAPRVASRAKYIEKNGRSVAVDPYAPKAIQKTNRGSNSQYKSKVKLPFSKKNR
jgi:hypothetical protein